MVLDESSCVAWETTHRSKTYGDTVTSADKTGIMCAMPCLEARTLRLCNVTVESPPVRLCWWHTAEPLQETEAWTPQVEATWAGSSLSLPHAPLECLLPQTQSLLPSGSANMQHFHRTMNWVRQTQQRKAQATQAVAWMPLSVYGQHSR